MQVNGRRRVTRETDQVIIKTKRRGREREKRDEDRIYTTDLVCMKGEENQRKKKLFLIDGK